MTGKRLLGRSAAIAAALVAVALGNLATAGSASASTQRNGVLSKGEFGLFYNTGERGAVFDVYWEDTNLKGNYFPQNPNIQVNDNTGSCWNKDSYRWYYFEDAYGGGDHEWMPAGYAGTFYGDLRNGVSSVYFYDPN